MQYDLYIFAIGSFLFLVFSHHLLFTKHGNTYLNKLFAVFMLTRGCQMLYFILVNTGQTFLVSFFFTFINFFCFAYPACTYLYIRGFLRNESRLQCKDWFHFIPILFAILNCFPWHMLDVSTRTGVIKEIIDHKIFYVNGHFGIFSNEVNFFLRSFLIIIYLFFNWRIVLQSDIIKNRKSNPVANNWILFLITAMTITNLTFLVTSVINFLRGAFEGNLFFCNYRSIFICITVIASIGFVLYNPKVLYGYVFVSREYTGFEKGKNVIKLVPETLIDFVVTPIIKSTQNQIPTDLVDNKQIYLERIVSYIENQKPFLNADFSLSILSQETNIPVHHCSYILNNIIEMNFRDWINSYRIAHFIEEYPKKRNKNTTIAIALDCGFNNKVTFYNAFNKVKGISPTTYFKI